MPARMVEANGFRELSLDRFTNHGEGDGRQPVGKPVEFGDVGVWKEIAPQCEHLAELQIDDAQFFERLSYLNW